MSTKTCNTSLLQKSFYGARQKKKLNGLSHTMDSDIYLYISRN